MKRVLLFIVLAVVLVVGFAVFAADGAEEGLSQWRIAVTTVAAGLIGVPLVQLLKKLLPESITKAFMTYIAYAAAFITALIVFAATGGLSTLLSTPWVVLGEGSAVFAIMTIIYNTLKERMGLKSPGGS